MSSMNNNNTKLKERYKTDTVYREKKKEIARLHYYQKKEQKMNQPVIIQKSTFFLYFD
jgi:hypothetical protein